ncbi:heat shock 70 kDa protein 12B isoform X2 [Rhea pennata]|uniref:heat shock 70 kDa protein 12B isoform X2 n=1 Tax=Rhea pennata TaxID=8795 RepID=UPI002E276526
MLLRGGSTAAPGREHRGSRVGAPWLRGGSDAAPGREHRGSGVGGLAARMGSHAATHPPVPQTCPKTPSHARGLGCTLCSCTFRVPSGDAGPTPAPPPRGRDSAAGMATLPEPGARSLHVGAAGPPGSPGTGRSCSIAPLTPTQPPRSEARAPGATAFAAVVAVDLGTAGSGYAFALRSAPEAVHAMSFGYAARDHYHGLPPEEARGWLYFEKFKMQMQSSGELSARTELEAANGQKVPALEVLAHALRFFQQRAVQELREQCPALPEQGAVRWVLTVPAVWKPPAKQLMREAAYRAGLASPESPEQLLIALEPEAAAVYCRMLRLHQLLELSCQRPANGPAPERPVDSSFRQAREQLRRSRHSRTFLVEPGVGELWAEMQAGDRYIVADCGGGTVDLTVHQIEKPQGTLKELYKASGGPCGAVGVDLAFERLLCRIFGEDFIGAFKARRPAAWVDLGIAFEAGKRAAAPARPAPLSVSLPFSFVDFHREHRGRGVETALEKSDVNFVKWSSQGLLRLSPEAVSELFQPTISQIIEHVGELLRRPELRGVKLLFLVGGFAESALLRRAARAAWGAACRVAVPRDAALAVLKGAVLFGLDPAVVRVRRSPLAYGVGVLNKFVEGKHPPEKLLVKEGRSWCTDVFEKFVSVDQSVALGEVVQRSYCPARAGQRQTVINIYCCATDDAVYITDPGVRKCGTVTLELDEAAEAGGAERSRREIRASMQFGDTEIKVTAVDVRTSKTVRATIDFLSD